MICMADHRDCRCPPACCGKVRVMALPFLVFWVIVFVGREGLGFKGFAFCVLLWAGLLAACMFLGFSPYTFVFLQALFDIVLILVVFGHDIRIR